MIANKRPSTYRATHEGEKLDLRSFLAELVEGPPLTSNKPPLNRTSSVWTVSHIIAAALTSPYREADFYPKATPSFLILPFSRQTLLVDLLGVLDEHGEPAFNSRRAPVAHLELDMCQPAPTMNMNERQLPKFHPQDLAPLILFRHLTYLKIDGMTQSYQLQIWQCVWLNPGLSTLSLSMSTDSSQILCSRTIRVARFLAESYPSMRQVCHGNQWACAPGKFSLARLELTRFVVGSEPFEWFDGRKLKEVRFTECKDAGFRLMGDGWRTTTVVVDPGNSQPERTSTNLMSPRKRRPSTVDRGSDWYWPSARDLAALRSL